MATLTLSRQELKSIASGLHKAIKKLEANKRRKPWGPHLGARDLATEQYARLNALLGKIQTAINNEPEEPDAQA